MWKITRTPKKSGEVISPTLTIEVMGYSIPIDLTVLPGKTLGTYNHRTRRVTVDPSKSSDDYELAYTVAHECHHWLIHNGNRTMLPKDRRQIRLQNVLLRPMLILVTSALCSSIVILVFVYLSKQFWMGLLINSVLGYLIARLFFSSKIAYRYDAEEHTANRFAEESFLEFMSTVREIRLIWRLQEITHPSED